MRPDSIELESALIKISSLAAAAMMLDEPEEEKLRSELITLIQRTADSATSSKKGGTHA